MKKEINVKELEKILKEDKLKNYILIDVRTKAENRSVNIQEATNIPLDSLEEHKKELEKYDTVFLHCRSGGRSLEGCKKLQDLKNTNVINVKGGILDWQSQGFHTIKSKNGTNLSITQQVFIIAGSLVLIGAILSKLIDPNWIYLSGFVGAGLLFAGASGHCLMGNLLSKMPWNK